MNKRIVPKVLAASSVYINPSTDNSTVSYKVIDGRHLYGEVELADCSRKISWYFPDRATSLPKIDKAIEALQAFRVEFAAAKLAKLKRARKKPRVVK